MKRLGGRKNRLSSNTKHRDRLCSDLFKNPVRAEVALEDKWQLPLIQS
jgi:hypothetical protein